MQPGISLALPDALRCEEWNVMADLPAAQEPKLTTAETVRTPMTLLLVFPKHSESEHRPQPLRCGVRNGTECHGRPSCCAGTEADDCGDSADADDAAAGVPKALRERAPPQAAALRAQAARGGRSHRQDFWGAERRSAQTC